MQATTTDQAVLLLTESLVMPAGPYLPQSSLCPPLATQCTPPAHHGVHTGLHT
uniref:Uncharacterized protein n=1 Tax=Catenaria anguillulae PL171 TaxID=765915 RepID=A0A1Y2I1D5_9FUNG|nr:hypothetical protein BCR44DRAFT_1423604 [Catenaria anguillulae PL171]